ncbi:hypothetical protein V5P93_007057 [Actinokineospora auranticolor]|uniref:Type VII secretion system (Wss) protein ESAT-6 n=1 Tax=Actinokineospora auranticolor TaxID=155976 RepID=A0A2S6GH10_9PSEU|nr:hypothetical protein [Actinokineospora auranticolor]PPK64493.1 hypothetical protein CLV40_11957 [Actinokineospora auranticolor]
MSGYPGLGFDPTPGDPDAVMSVVAEYRAAAAALAAVGPDLRRVESATDGWTGPAADAFAGRVDAVPADLDTRSANLRRAADLLTTWAQTLAAGKRAADDLERAATRLRDRISDATDDLHARRTELDLAATPVAAAKAGMDHAAAEAELTALRDRLADVVRRARVLAADHERAADEVADALRPAHRAKSPTSSIAALLDRVSTTSAALGGLVLSSGPPTRSTGAAGTFAAAVATGAGGGGPVIEVVERAR